MGPIEDLTFISLRSKRASRRGRKKYVKSRDTGVTQRHGSRETGREISMLLRAGSSGQDSKPHTLVRKLDPTPCN